MATKNPRIAFVPSDEVLRLVSQLAGVSGQSKASIVSELMDDLAPVVLGQLEAFRAIAAKPEKVRQHVEALAAESIAQIGQATMAFGKPKRKPRAKSGG
jgi:hypothetical protein